MDTGSTDKPNSLFINCVKFSANSLTILNILKTKKKKKKRRKGKR